MHQCLDSFKCIAKSRLFDRISDCPFNDDEDTAILNKTCSQEENLNFFRCVTTNECIAYHLVQDGDYHCSTHDGKYCDDEHFDVSYAKHHIQFQTICDGFNQLLFPIDNETDETNCDEWECNNIYTRCDGFWHCLNGADEMSSTSSTVFNCSTNHHVCISMQTKQLMCLSIERANDEIIDCLGAADEPKFCNRNKTALRLEQFYCQNDTRRACISHSDICNRKSDCAQNEDEEACQAIYLISHGGICQNHPELHGSEIGQVLCRHFRHTGERWRIYFQLDEDQH